MKLSKLALIAAVACGTNAVNLTTASAGELNLVGCSEPVCDCGEPVCGCEPVTCCDDACEPDCGCEETSCCDSACEPECCDSSCDSVCCDSGCDSGCDSAAGCGGGISGCLLPGLCGGDCDLGDPHSLFDGCACGIEIGGWASIGYHSAALPLFNSRPEEVQLHQAWVYAEKALDTSDGFDIGGRFDIMYGTDSQDTQVFGIDDDHWDNGWDNGNDYGFALPQLYVEAGYGDLSVKAGHFYTIIGWEVVGAPDNFFYSHAYTMYNSEPFTHTGALATYTVSDDLEVYGGYVTGWDSGFKDNGDAFLGGASLTLSDDLSLIYATVGGRFDDGDAGIENGYMHSIVADYMVCDNLEYIFQSDLLETEDEDGLTVRSTFGINQYLIYTINDCLAMGTRFEWYGADEGVFNTGNDVYAWTSGINYKPHANVIMRPELRYDWVSGDPSGILEDDDDSQFSFGMDTIFLF
ncbi:MAG: outer membrane beta-barrel protein [Planctomycetota bacterium]